MCGAHGQGADAATVRRQRRGDLRAHGVALIVAAASIGCGDVVFVDPDLALKQRLTLTRAEFFQVSGDPRDYLWFTLGSNERLDGWQLAVTGPSGAHQLGLSTLVATECVAGWCASLSLPPGTLADADELLLTVPAIGHESRFRLRRQLLGPHQLSGEALDRNSKLRLLPLDPIATFLGQEGLGQTFPRSFEVHLSAGVCLGPPDPADPAWQVLPRSPTTLALPTAPEGWCANLRPRLPQNGPSVASVAISARAVVRNFTHTFTPSVEVSPLVVQPIFDLELPSEERCRDAQGLVLGALRSAAESLAAGSGPGAEVLMLPPIELAQTDGRACRQPNNRFIIVSAVRNQVQSALDERFGPGRRARVVYVYANNLDLALPPALNVTLGLLASNDPLSARQSYLLVLGPARVLSELPVDASLSWVSTEEPSFARDIEATMTTAWPFRTVLHSSSTVVPMLGDAPSGIPIGYRICSSTGAIRPLGAAYPSQTAYASPPDGPAYQVDLAPQILVPTLDFVVPSVVIEWQACDALCDRPAPGADPQISWEQAQAC